MGDPGSAGGGPVLDPRRVEALRALDSPGTTDVSHEVARLFLQTAAEGVAAMERALADGDAPTLREQAHRVKGSCGNVGATRLEAICQLLETAGREGRIPSGQEAALEAAWAAVRAAVATEFGVAPPA